MIPPLFEHQEESLRFLAERNKALDFSDPGTGKTRVQIEHFLRHRRNGGKCALIIAPKSLLQSAWEDDFQRFAPGIKTSVAYASNREKAFKANADVYITNTDATVWLAQQPKTFFDKFDTLIIDELSYFKHRSSNRTKSLIKIRKYFSRVYGLTGTPNANNLLDIWAQVFIVDQGETLGSSFFAFRNVVCTPQQIGPSPNMVKWVTKPGSELAVAGLLTNLTIRHKFEECLSIPENVITFIKYHPSNKVRKAYKELRKSSILLLSSLNNNVPGEEKRTLSKNNDGICGRYQDEQPASIDTNEKVSAVNAAVLTNKLLQTLSGSVYNDDGSVSSLDDERSGLVSELVQAREQCIVFFLWEHQRDGLVRHFKNSDISHRIIDGNTSVKDKLEAVKLFQAGLIKVLLAHPASAAHGLTLTKGTTTIWTSPTSNLEHFLQGNRRIYRAGQKQKTETIVLLVEGSIEETVCERLKERNERQLDLLNLLQTLKKEDTDEQRGYEKD